MKHVDKYIAGTFIDSQHFRVPTLFFYITIAHKIVFFFVFFVQYFIYVFQLRHNPEHINISFCSLVSFLFQNCVKVYIYTRIYTYINILVSCGRNRQAKKQTIMQKESLLSLYTFISYPKVNGTENTFNWSVTLKSPVLRTLECKTPTFI